MQEKFEIIPVDHAPLCKNDERLGKNGVCHFFPIRTKRRSEQSTSPETETLKLYYDPNSTASRIVTFLLFDQAIVFDEEILHLASGDNHRDAFVAINPGRTVPVLADGDFRLTESSAIARYLAITGARHLYPDDLRKRSRIDEAVSWFQTNFHLYHCSLWSYSHILPSMKALEPAVLATIREMGRRGSEACLTIIDNHMLADRTFVCGGEISIADYVGAANVTLGACAGQNFSRYPNIARWLQTLRRRQGWDPAYAAFEGSIAALGLKIETI
jgi:glutathione S-transferase